MIIQVHETYCRKCQPGHLILQGGEEGPKRIFLGDKESRQSVPKEACLSKAREEVFILKAKSTLIFAF